MSVVARVPRPCDLPFPGHQAAAPPPMAVVALTQPNPKQAGPKITQGVCFQLDYPHIQAVKRHKVFANALSNGHPSGR